MHSHTDTNTQCTLTWKRMEAHKYAVPIHSYTHAHTYTHTHSPRPPHMHTHKHYLEMVLSICLDGASTFSFCETLARALHWPREAFLLQQGDRVTEQPSNCLLASSTHTCTHTQTHTHFQPQTLQCKFSTHPLLLTPPLSFPKSPIKCSSFQQHSEAF